jgi:photosystem II stability/assembly factor-like uncharacterized protein
MKHLKFLFLLIFLTSGISSQDENWFYRNPLPQNDLYSIKFLNPDTGYVCGSKGLILKTITGDNQWLNQSLVTSRNLYSLYFFDAENGFIAGDSGLMVRTTNGGTNWLEITTGVAGALRSITFSDSVTGFAVGDNGIVIKSTDSGESWSVNYNAPQNLHSVFFVSSSKGFAGGENGLLLRTTNSGINWSTQYLGSETLNSIDFPNPLVGFILSSGEMYKSSDGGQSWTSQYFSGGNWHSVKFLNQETGYAAGSIIEITFNGGQYWDAYPIGTEGSFFNDICPVDTFLYTCSTKGYIYKICNNIFFGKKINIGGSMHPFSSISFVNENTGYIVSDDEYLRTTNGGLNWDIDLPLYRSFEGGESFIDVIFYSPSRAYRLIRSVSMGAGSTDHLQNSTNGGLTWNGPKSFLQTGAIIYGMCEVQSTAYITIGRGSYLQISPGIKKNNGSGWYSILNSDSLQFDKISFANENTGVCIFRWANYGFVRTTDGGTSWFTFNSFFPKSPINVQLLPTGTGYVIGDSSLFGRTTDFGASWTYIPHNISKMFVKLQFIDDNTGWIISQNYGWPYINRLYYTSNGGLDLLQVQSLDSFEVRGMSFLNALTGYVCGDSGTVLKTTNGGLVFVNPISSDVPKSYLLSQNYPNPFNPATTINYELPEAGYVKLVVYDILGREIAILVNEKESAGIYKVQWDASPYPSGVYFYKLVTEDFSETKRMVLVK